MADLRHRPWHRRPAACPRRGRGHRQQTRWLTPASMIVRHAVLVQRGADERSTVRSQRLLAWPGPPTRDRPVMTTGARRPLERDADSYPHRAARRVDHGPSAALIA